MEGGQSRSRWKTMSMESIHPSITGNPISSVWHYFFYIILGLYVIKYDFFPFALFWLQFASIQNISTIFYLNIILYKNNTWSLWITKLSLLNFELTNTNIFLINPNNCFMNQQCEHISDPQEILWNSKIFWQKEPWWHKQICFP